MSHPDLRSFIATLEKEKTLVRVEAPVDPDQEITVIQHRVLPWGGPALLFENVKGSPHRLVTNLFGTLDRVEKAIGHPPGELGEMVASLAERLTPPSIGKLWGARRDIRGIFGARLRRVRSGPVLDETREPPDLHRLPVLKCWPEDGGHFFTLPLVHTTDPETGVGNLGIYRLQRYDATTTGMHWQIEKGGGFHFQRACELGRPLPISVILGGPPALTIAAVTPLPEGIDERLLAALMLKKPLDVILRSTTGHRIPSQAEFVLEGSVVSGDVRREGPFGDHLGHYSHSADFPVFRVVRVLSRKDAIYPATVVGKPPQEDYFIGVALQEMTLPLLKLIRPAIIDLWSYPESGFHPLAVASVKERYPKETLKHALGILGEGQLSLTKVLIITGTDCDDVKNFKKVSRAVWRHLDTSEGVHLLAPTAQDTLDFTGPAMNTGSRLILLAANRPEGPLRTEPPKPPPRPDAVHGDIEAFSTMGEAFLIVRVKGDADRKAVREALFEHPVTGGYLFHVLLSSDVPIDDPMMVLWGWFTRFDPLADLHPKHREASGNRMVLHFPIAIDATWKPGYRNPVVLDPDVERTVAARWGQYGID